MSGPASYSEAHFLDDFKLVFSPAKRSRSMRAASERLRRLPAHGSPQVMLKITGWGRGGGKLQAHGDYISRNGKIPVYDSMDSDLGDDGPRRDKVRDFMDGLIERDTGRANRRYTMNMMLSMPPGTDPDRFAGAVRGFLATEFDNHPYLYAFHNDTDHPHAHIVVAIKGHDGERLNPRKADLQDWREHFADALVREGIEADATPALARGRAGANILSGLLRAHQDGRAQRALRSPSFDASALDRVAASQRQAIGRMEEYLRANGVGGLGGRLAAWAVPKQSRPFDRNQSDNSNDENTR